MKTYTIGQWCSKPTIVIRDEQPNYSIDRDLVRLCGKAVFVPGHQMSDKRDYLGYVFLTPENLPKGEEILRGGMYEKEEYEPNSITS